MLLTSNLMSAGVAITAVRVDTVVIKTDKGTSAPARYVTTLLATPVQDHRAVEGGIDHDVRV